MRTIIAFLVWILFIPSLAFAGDEHHHDKGKKPDKKIVIVNKTVNKVVNKVENTTHVINTTENNNTYVTNENKNTYVTEIQKPDHNAFDYGAYLETVLLETKNTEWGILTNYLYESNETRVFAGGKIYLNRILKKGVRDE